MNELNQFEVTVTFTYETGKSIRDVPQEVIGQLSHLDIGYHEAKCTNISVKAIPKASKEE